MGCARRRKAWQVLKMAGRLRVASAVPAAPELLVVQMKQVG